MRACISLRKASNFVEVQRLSDEKERLEKELSLAKAVRTETCVRACAGHVLRPVGTLSSRQSWYRHSYTREIDTPM